jgi:hypothetical protein
MASVATANATSIASARIRIMPATSPATRRKLIPFGVGEPSSSLPHEAIERGSAGTSCPGSEFELGCGGKAQAA